MPPMTDRLIQSRKNQQTGTIIDVLARTDTGYWNEKTGEYGERRIYETICVDHGTVCAHDTRHLALSHAAAPLGWCEDCMTERDRAELAHNRCYA